MRKRLLIATGIFPPSIGGPATYSKLLMEELPHAGVSPVVVSFDAVRKWPKGVRHVIYFLKLYNAAAQADIIYAQDPVSVGYPAMWVSWLRAIPLYLRVPGDYAWEQACQRYGVTDVLDTFLQNKKYPSPVLRLRRIQKKVAAYARGIIVPSIYLKGVVQSWGIPEEKISVIGNAIEGEMPTESKELLRSELGFKKKTLITAGRFVPWKGFAAVITGLAPYLKEKDISLIIAGSGPDEVMLRASVKEQELEDRVTFLGMLSHRDLMRYIKASDIFILNTAYEGFSHQILEAMAMRTPIVTTNVGGNPELIEDGNHGFLVSLNDIEGFRSKIETLLSNQSLAEAIGEHAAQRASLFTKGRAVTSLVSILNSAFSAERK